MTFVLKHKKILLELLIIPLDTKIRKLQNFRE